MCVSLSALFAWAQMPGWSENSKSRVYLFHQDSCEVLMRHPSPSVAMIQCDCPHGVMFKQHIIAEHFGDSVPSCLKKKKSSNMVVDDKAICFREYHGFPLPSQYWEGSECLAAGQRSQLSQKAGNQRNTFKMQVLISIRLINTVVGLTAGVQRMRNSQSLLLLTLF